MRLASTAVTRTFRARSYEVAACGSALFLVTACAATETTPPDGSTSGGGAGKSVSGGSAGRGTVAGQGGSSTSGGSAGSATTTGGASGSGTGGAGGTGGATAGANNGNASGAGGATGGGAPQGGRSGSGGTAAGRGGLSAGGATTGGASSGGAGSGNAGSSAGGAPAAGSGGGGGCPATAAVCENFESGSLGTGWKKVESGGTLSVDGTHVSEGTQALAINIPAQQRGGFLQFNGAPLFPLPNNSLYGRVMVYFESVADGHTDIIRASAANNAVPQYNIGEQHGDILINYYNGSAADCWARPSPTKKVPLSTWMCWEWEYHGPTNEIDFYIDGTLSRKVSATGDGCLATAVTWTAPTFADFRIGEYIAELSSTGVKMWLDDIAVGNTERIGCPSPSGMAK